MNTMKTRIITLLLLATVSLYSQQDSQFTQYMYNTINVNPAYAGSRGVTSLFALHRQQWVGLSGAPVTSVFSGHTALAHNTGAGLTIIKDAIGAQDQTSIAGDFSYTIYVAENVKLSFGLKASLNMLNIDFTKLNIQDGQDPRLQNLNNRTNPNIGAGAYLHGKKGYVGLSVPQFLETEQFKENPSGSSTTAKQRMHTYFIGGYVFDLKDNLKFKPAVLSKLVAGAPLQVDLSANFLIDQKLTLGLAYRLSKTVSALVGFQINEQLYAGYAYDAEATALSKYNGGSHEIFLRYELFKNYGKITSPRFF